MKLKTKDRKKFRIRNRLKKFNPNNRMRLSISRSSKNISAQIIDDDKNITILSASSKDKLIKAKNKNTAVEALTPDFKGLSSSIDTLVNCGLEVFA